uniref:Predicted protein n=1 Tax=Hordeum vulgare subsp. vulgare TaxID=112509 RepID=F2E6S9_HORVV|nr:predicted protein [Hordeum vulgare subsp. vulgare]
MWRRCSCTGPPIVKGPDSGMHIYSRISCFPHPILLDLNLPGPLAPPIPSPQLDREKGAKEGFHPAH